MLLVKKTTFEYDQQATAVLDLSESKPVIFIGATETFMSREGSLGFVRSDRCLLDRPLKFVVFDEYYLIYEWGCFRSSFLEPKTLTSSFPRTTFLAVTATLLPKNEKMIVEEFLHNPCLDRMSVDRPNVRLEISTVEPTVDFTVARIGLKVGSRLPRESLKQLMDS